CTFSAYLYRNGAGYQAADYLSLTANGALQFNGANVMQANGTSLYYLKGGRYHVDWVIDRDAKHQTVTLTGLINSKEGQTITVADADFEDRNNVSFEYTSGIQLKGGNLYIDNIKAEKNIEGPIEGFMENNITVSEHDISGFINGYPVSAITPIWKNGMTGTAIVKNIYGETVTDGGIYDGYTYEVTDSNDNKFVYTFNAVTDIYSNSFNSEVMLSDGSSEITSANTGQRDKMFPSADAVYTVTNAKPTNSGGTQVSGWDQSLFQSVIVGDTNLSLNRETAPYKTDRAIAFKANGYAGEKNIQVIKDFYAGEEDYPVQISMSIMPDGNGDVSFGVKTSYYGESWRANIDATDGAGLNSIATPIAFMANGKIMCFGRECGVIYEPGNWYNVSLVLDKVTVDGVTTKKAYAYLNGEKIGEYDWSTIEAQIKGNEGFYSVTMRENYKTEEIAATSKTYFDNLHISRLYNTDAMPNGYMFTPVSENAAVTINNFGGSISIFGNINAADCITVPAGVSVTEQDGRLILKSGDYVQTYTIKEAVPTVTVEDSKATVVNSEDGVLIAAVYNADSTLARVYTAAISGGEGEVTFEKGESQSVKIMGWDSLAGQKPIFDVN
ncbi:MAG: hypothetical protein PUD92_06895, partial [Clostridiales bacterium]|nr:hypothetical protein [Clostridiales bacterium]